MRAIFHRTASLGPDGSGSWLKINRGTPCDLNGRTSDLSPGPQPLGGDDLMQTFDGGVPDGNRGASDKLMIVVEPDPQGVHVRLMGEVDLATARARSSAG